MKKRKNQKHHFWKREYFVLALVLTVLVFLTVMWGVDFIGDKQMRMETWIFLGEMIKDNFKPVVIFIFIFLGLEKYIKKSSKYWKLLK